MALHGIFASYLLQPRLMVPGLLVFESEGWVAWTSPAAIWLVGLYSPELLPVVYKPKHERMEAVSAFDHNWFYGTFEELDSILCHIRIVGLPVIY